MRTVSGDRGESLVEILVAVTLMGVALVAIVGGLVTTIKVSDIHRKQATAGVAVRDYAEAIQHAVDAGKYKECALPADYASPAGFAVPGGYSKSVIAGSVRYWDGSAWATACPAPDRGLQQLTIEVASTDSRAAERMVIVVRKPCQTTDSPC
jgi:type II secretory pathway pseudopilin PulG